MVWRQSPYKSLIVSAIFFICSLCSARAEETKRKEEANILGNGNLVGMDLFFFFSEFSIKIFFLVDLGRSFFFLSASERSGSWCVSVCVCVVDTQMYVTICVCTCMYAFIYTTHNYEEGEHPKTTKIEDTGNAYQINCFFFLTYI